MMKEVIIVLLILLSYILSAFADAIDHAKGGDKLNTLWHISKALSYGIPFTVILYLLRVPCIIWILMWIALWIYFELFYRVFRFLEVYRLDNKDIAILKKIWRY